MRVQELQRRKPTDSKAHSNVVGGSTAKLRLACSGSRVMEADIVRETSVYADRGTALHHVCEVALNEQLSDADVLAQFQGVALKLDDMQYTIDLTPELITRKVWPALQFTDDVVPPTATLYTEAKVGLQFGPGRAGGDLDMLEIDGAFGTGDLVWSCTQTNRHGVGDFKFGEGRIIRADDNDQGRFYLTGAIMRGLLPVVDEYEFWIFQPADKLDPSEYASKGVYTLADLVRFNRDLHDAITSEPVFTPGPHCGDCKGKLACAAYKEFMFGVVERKTDIPGMKLSELAKLYGMVKTLRQTAEDIEAAVLRNARAGLVISGYQLEPALGHTAWVDETAAEQALARKGVDVKDRRVVRTISPTQALKKLADIGTPKKEIDRFAKTHTHRPTNGDKLVPIKKGAPATGVAGMAEALTALAAR